MDDQFGIPPWAGLPVLLFVPYHPMLWVFYALVWAEADPNPRKPLLPYTVDAAGSHLDLFHEELCPSHSCPLLWRTVDELELFHLESHLPPMPATNAWLAQSTKYQALCLKREPVMWDSFSSGPACRLKLVSSWDPVLAVLSSSVLAYFPHTPSRKSTFPLKSLIQESLSQVLLLRSPP